MNKINGSQKGRAAKGIITAVLLIFLIAVSVNFSSGIHAGKSFSSSGLLKTVSAEKAVPGQKGKVNSLPEAATKDWISKAKEEIRKSEYRVSYAKKTALPEVAEAYQAPNRENNIRTYFTKDGIVVIPRTEEVAWKWGLRLKGIPDSMSQDPKVSGNRVEYAHGVIREWYINDDKGLEQGFEVTAPDERFVKDGRLAIELTVTGDLKPKLADNGQAIDFLNGEGARPILYDHLKSFDAKGRELASRMELADAGSVVRLVVDVKDAVWPVMIDPVATSPNWMAEGGQAGAVLGASVAGAGDVDGNGYADVIIGAPNFDAGQVDEGKVFLFKGRSWGLTADYWGPVGGQAGISFGYSVAGAGDVNGDGYADVIIGAPNYVGGEAYEGRAYVYYGSAIGLKDYFEWSMEGNQTGSSFGFSVAGVGDVNGDGYADVMVGAPSCDDGQTDEGQVYGYYGSANGLYFKVGWTFEGNQAYARFGLSVAGAGDVNGDGYADIIISAPGYDTSVTDGGRVFVYYGSPYSALFQAQTPWINDGGSQAYAYFGTSVAGAGDVDGDGYTDVIIGAPNYDNGAHADAGGVWIFYGSALGIKSGPWCKLGAQAGANFGFSVAGVGDVNGDGYADVVIGEPGYDNGAYTDTGRVLVYYGSASGAGVSPALIRSIYQTGAQFGYSVAGAGDVNGDGYADIIAGAPWYDKGETDEGIAVAYYGAASVLAAAPNWTDNSDQPDSAFGFSVAGAEDINGDGYSDVIIGAPYYDSTFANAGKVFVYYGSATGLRRDGKADWDTYGIQAGEHFGYSVAGAGDVNGDGYADLIVGSPSYDSIGLDTGRVYVYHGGATGPKFEYSREGSSGSWSGWSVASAGDVNGDGYADVIIGAPGNDKVYVYYGSATGLASSANRTLKGDQPNAFFGYSVAGAGDVNGDGYADVIVGAPKYDNPVGIERVITGGGRAFVYHGSIAGLYETPDWTYVMYDQINAFFGWSVAGTGDVDGDGFGDVIISAPFYVNGTVQGGGAVWVFYGSVSGLNSATFWQQTALSARFGVSVAGAGDVNGDGYADVIIGASDCGELACGGSAYMYLGSSIGLKNAQAWLSNGKQTDTEFGSSVAGVGDINGDGYADVIIGCGYDRKGEGVYVYYGNGLSGRPVVARQFRGSSSTVAVQPWGQSYQLNDFQVKLLQTNPFGKGRAKLQVEACPQGKPFGSTACKTSTTALWIETGAGIGIRKTVNGLSPSTLYRWRARYLYAPYTVNHAGIIPPPNPAHGPWRRLMGQATEADIRTYPQAVVTDVSSTKANGFYKAGTSITITVAFSAPVTVTGTPALLLETGATNRTATYTAGSGTSKLSFNYIVQAGDTSADLDYVAKNSLTLNGGTIKDSMNFDASLTLPAPKAAGSLSANKDLVIDTTAPTFEAVTPDAVTTEQGKAQTFVSVYSDANLKTADVLFNTGISATNSILVSYNTLTKKASLDGAVSTCSLDGSAGTLSNTQGVIDCQKTTVTVVGNKTIIKWHITPAAVFASTTPKKIFTRATDKAGHLAAWTAQGFWKIMSSNKSPIIVSLTPAALTSRTNSAQNFIAVYEDPDGSENLKSVELLVTTPAAGSIDAFWVQYDSVWDQLRLKNDGGSEILATCKPGEKDKLGADVIIWNTQGLLNCGLTTVTRAGNDITVDWHITPLSGFTGQKEVTMKAIDFSNVIIGWKMGIWTINP